MAQRSPSRAFMLLLVVLATGLLGWIMWPLASPFFVAGVVAGALYPLYAKLVKRVRGKRNLAATLIVIGVTLILVLPTGTLTALAVKEALDGINYVRTAFQSQGVAGMLERLPHSIQSTAHDLVESLPKSLSAITGEQGASAAAAVGGLLSATTSAVVQTLFALIALFFLLVDGPQLVNWLDETIPLARGRFRELLGEFRHVSVSVIVSTVATAGVQTLAAAIGYFIARVPNALFFALVTFFMSFVPAVGAASVSVFLAVLLFLGGKPIGWCIFLLAWGVMVVGLSDNLARPLFIKGEVEMHGAVVFFSLIGGLAALGGVGLLAGPLIVAFFLAVIRMERRGHTQPSPPANEAQPAPEQGPEPRAA